MKLLETEYIDIECPPSVERATEVARTSKQQLIVVTPYQVFAAIEGVKLVKPCPCGWFGHSQRKCSCSISQIERHQRKYKQANALWLNGVISWRMVKIKKMSEICTNLLKQVYIEWGLVDELLTIIQAARAAADMSKDKEIQPEHIAEGIAYRCKF